MKLAVVSPYVSNYPNPIRFGAGESVITGRTDDEFPGWIWCKTADANEGWAPEVLLRKTTERTAVTTADYTAHELNTKAGDALEGLKTLNGWIWCRDQSGCEGWVPEKSVKPV